MAENGRYWLFFGDDHYPGGGFEDFIAASDSIDELRERVEMGSENCCGEAGFDPRGQWWHIIDTKTVTIVKEHCSWEPSDEMQKRMDILDDADMIRDNRPKSGPKTGGQGDSPLSPVYESKE